jgi:hypothetical protein
MEEKMRDSLQKRCELFIQNNEVMRKAFTLEFDNLHVICAIIVGERQIDIQKIKDCQKIIKNKTSLFSSFRSTSFLALATLLSLEDDPEKKMDSVIETYSILKEYKFKDSDYLALSAFLIQDADRGQKEKWIAKASDIYSLLKSKYPMLTSAEDYGYAVLLALSNRSAEAVVSEKGQCFDLLKGNFLSKDAVQSLSFILALSQESAAVKCEKAMRLFNELKGRGYKIGTDMELPGLGALTMIAKNESQTISDVIEVSDFLKKHKGFGDFRAGKAQRLLYAIALVVQENGGDDDVLNATLTTTLANILIAMQIILIMVICMSVVVTVSSAGD